MCMHTRPQVRVTSRSTSDKKEKSVKLRHLIVVLAAILMLSAHAAPADDVQAAVKRLANAGYTWSIVSEHKSGDFKFSVSQHGKIDKDGVAVFARTIGGNDTQ